MSLKYTSPSNGWDVDEGVELCVRRPYHSVLRNCDLFKGSHQSQRSNSISDIGVPFTDIIIRLRPHSQQVLALLEIPWSTLLHLGIGYCATSPSIEQLIWKMGKSRR